MKHLTNIALYLGLGAGTHALLYSQTFNPFDMWSVAYLLAWWVMLIVHVVKAAFWWLIGVVIVVAAIIGLCYAAVFYNEHGRRWYRRFGGKHGLKRERA